MDVANRLARLQERTPEQWLRAANTVLPVGVTAVLVIALAWRLADLTWSILPGERADDPYPEVAALAPATGTTNPIPPVTLNALSEAHLFGEPAVPPADAEASAAAAVATADAPDTTLNLVLAGVVAREPGSEPGQAIILSGNREQKVYSVGDTIDGTNGARLHSVLADRVLLNRSGRLEALRLPRELPSQARQIAPRIAPRPLSGGGVPDNRATLTEVIGANASRISDVIRIAPAIDSGQVVGFRVNPGADAAAFTALGLEPGDIVTEVNGTVIDDPNRGLQVFEALGETTMANVTLLRNGAPQAVVIDTSQLLEIAE